MAKSLRCLLISIQTSDGRTRVVIDDKVCVVGRSEDTDIVIDDLNVSRRHFIVRARGESVTIEDLESSHGTFVNGEQIQAKVQHGVLPDDSITLGKTNVVMRVENMERVLTNELINSSSASRLDRRTIADLLESAKIQNQEILRKSHEIAEKTIQDANQLADSAVASANELSQRTMSDAQEQADAMLHAARSEAENLMNEARSFSEQTRLQIQEELTEAQTQSQDLLVKAKEKSERILVAADAKADDLVHAAQEKADEILFKAQRKASDLETNADKQSKKLLKDSKESADRMLRTATEESKSLLEKARIEADQTTKAARDGARAEAERTYETVLQEQRDLAERIVSDAQQKAETEAKEIKERLVTEGRLNGERILAAKKTEANQIILHAEQTARELTETSKRDADKLLSEATKESERAYNEGQKEFERLRLSAQNEAKTITEAAEALAIKLRTEVKAEVAALQKDSKDLADKLVADAEMKARVLAEEAKALSQKLEREGKAASQKWVEEIKAENQKLLLEKIEVENGVSELQDYRQELQQKCDNYKEEIELKKQEYHQISGQKTAVEERVATLSREINARQSELKALDEKRTNAVLGLEALQSKYAVQENDLESQKVRTLGQIEEETAKLRAEQKKRLDHEYNQELERVRKLQSEYVQFVGLVQEKLSKNVGLAVQSSLSTILNKDQLTEISGKVSENVAQTLAQLAGEYIIQTDGKTPVRRMPQRSQQILWGMVGCFVGALIFYSGNLGWKKFIDPDANMSQIALEPQPKVILKYEPPQDDRLRESYTDAVISTKGFVQLYLLPDFQEKLFKAMSKYLLTVWRVEEMQTVQALSAAVALVKALDEQKQKIHPEAVEKGVQKMHDLEEQTRKQIAGILGSEVRYDAFKKFERNFYLEYNVSEEEAREPTGSNKHK